MITAAQAREQSDVLARAAAESPVVPIRSMLAVRSGEWAKAARWLENAEAAGESDGFAAMLLPFGMIESGNSLWWGGAIVQVLRTTATGVQVVEDGSGARWENVLSPQSPVVLVVAS